MEEKAVTVLEMLPEQTRSAIDLCPEAHRIKELLVVHALSRPAERPSEAELTRIVNEEFGTDLSTSAISHYLERYIAPAVFVTPAFVKKSLIDAGHDINTTRMRLEVLEAARDKFLEAMNDPKMPAGAVVGSAKDMMALFKEVDESLERFGAIPKKREERVNLNATLDMNEVMKSLS